VVRKDYRIGIPDNIDYKEIFNSDDELFWGSGVLNQEVLKAEDYQWQNRSQSITLTLPPLAGIILKPYKK